MAKQPRPRFSTRLALTAENHAIWLVAIVGLSLSVAALLLIQQQLDAHKLLDFEWESRNRIRALSHGIDISMLAVTTVQDHVLASGQVDAKGFRRYAESVIKRDPGIEALMWVPAVEASDRPAFEASTAREAGSAFQISESSGHFGLVRAADRADYFPAAIVVPNGPKSVPTGFDLGANPLFRETLERARDQGTIAASGRIAYPDEEGTQYGFMTASPVLLGTAGAPTPDNQQKKLAGFVVGFFRLSELSKWAISLLEPRGVEILILDATAPAAERFLHFYASRLVPRDVGPTDYEAWLKDPAEPKVVERIPVADREFAIISGRTDLFRSAEAFHQGPWAALVAGLLFTVLLSFYLARIKENIRQRLTMEQQLVEREELFRQMTETVDEAFWASTADGSELLYLSPAFEQILGLTEAGERSSLPDVVYPEDQAALAEALRRIGEGDTGIETVHRIERSDGMLRWVRTKGFAVKDERGSIYRLVGFLEDITERKQADEALRESEAKLRDMFQQSPDIIMTVDQRGTILLMNRSVPTLPADRAVGHSSLALMPAGLRKWFRKALKKVFRKGTTKQFQYSMNDGSYWEGRIVPIRGTDDGPVTAAMVIAGDVTEKRDLEAQALRNARLASIGVLSAGVAHEINNPNNAILFNASLVARAWRDITPILQEYMEEHGDFALGGLRFSEARNSLPQLFAEITRNSERIRRIVHNLKHMARQDTGELGEKVDIQQVLEATTMILHNQIQKYTDVYDFAVPDGLPRIRGNSQQIEQVFINVLLNALQALPERTKGVYIGASLDADDDMVKVIIRDEGHGISERDLGRLTEPFFTTRTEAGGTGLGLSISRAIVERHGGSISFESALGSGTKVTIRIPAIPTA